MAISENISCHKKKIKITVDSAATWEINRRTQHELIGIFQKNVATRIKNDQTELVFPLSSDNWEFSMSDGIA